MKMTKKTHGIKTSFNKFKWIPKIKKALESRLSLVKPAVLKEKKNKDNGPFECENVCAYKLLYIFQWLQTGVRGANEARGGYSFEPWRGIKEKGNKWKKERKEKKARIRGRRLAETVYENLASSIQRDSIVPKTAADTTPLNSSHFLNISAKVAHIVISAFYNLHVQNRIKFLFTKWVLICVSSI